MADNNAYRFLFTLSPRAHVEEMLRHMNREERRDFLWLVDSFKTIDSFGQYHAVDEKTLPFHKDSCLEKLRNCAIYPFLTQFPEYVRAEARYREAVIERLPFPEQIKLGVASLRALVKVGEALFEIAQGIDSFWRWGYMDTGKIEAISQEENTSVLVGKTETGEIVKLSQEVRPQGVYIIGNNGAGKSALIENMIVADLDQGLGVCLLDPDGDLTKNIIARCPENRIADIIHLNLMNTAYSFGLNLFECANPTDINQFELVASFVTHVFAKVWGGGYGSLRASQVLRNVTHTLIKNSQFGVTFADIPLLFSDEHVREKLVANVANPGVRAFWQQYNSMSPDKQIEYADPILSRVGEFLDRQSVTNIVGQSKTTLNFREIMDTGKVLLVQLSPEIEDISMLIGCVFVGKLLNAAYARQSVTEQERRRFHIYADEFQRFASEDFGTLINEARKFNIGISLAHQTTVQISETLKQAAISSGTKIIFRVSSDDARELAKVFDRTPKGQVQIGEEPVRAPAIDPLGFLLKNGHTDSAVIKLIEWVKTHNFVLDHTVVEPVKNDWGNFSQDLMKSGKIEGVPSYNEQKRDYQQWMQEAEKLNKFAHDTTNYGLRSAIEALNSYLYDAMKLGQGLLKKVPFSFIESFTSYDLFSVANLKGETVSSLLSSKYPSILAYLLDPSRLQKGDAAVQQLLPQIWRVHLEVGHSRYRTGRDVSFQSHVRTAVDLVDMVGAAALSLAKNPILVPTGQYKPKYQQRTYADMENEIASSLANMPDRRAKVKILDAEFEIATLPPSHGLTGQELADRLSSIQQQTVSSGVCVARSAVEQELATRQAGLAS